MTDISKRLAEIKDDFQHLRYDDGCRSLLAAAERIHVWSTDDVVTVKSSFGDGYREAMRDIRDLLAGALATDAKERQ